MAENWTSDSSKLTNSMTEPETLSSLDIDIPEAPQRIPGFVSSQAGYSETINAINDYLIADGRPPLKVGEDDLDLDLTTYYLHWGAMFGIPMARTVTVYNRVAQKKIDKTFRMRR